MTTDPLRRGRDAFAARAWADAYAQLAAANREAPLEPEDLERLATAAYLTGRDAESADLWALAHQAYLRRDQPEPAVRCASWLAFGLLNRGDTARGGGWLARASRLLDQRSECPERGYLLCADGYRRVIAGDYQAADAAFARATEIGERCADANLIALARHGWGRTLIRSGQAERGVALLDEAMAAVEAGEVSPLVVGDVYCSVIAGCMEVFDVRRAREWTAALSHWCEAQPDLVPYRGECLVRRAQLMQLHGAWAEAGEAAQDACERASRDLDPTVAGAAFYQHAELHRLRGELAEADEAYRQASRWGRSPQPGLALLRLAQGEADAAAAAIRGALDESREPRSRARLLPAAVEVLLAAADTRAARSLAGELAQLATDVGSPFLRALAADATGAVLLAEGDPRAALTLLREAWTIWQELEAPYEAARTRVRIAMACKGLGDEDRVALELDAARWAFGRLRAASDLARVEELSRAGSRAAGHGLTTRELQVLRLVADGRTNRAIAAELFISEKTVARHVSNIFTKLGLSTRAAATAYAYQNRLAYKWLQDGESLSADSRNRRERFDS